MYRKLSGLGLFACVFGLAFALYLQHYKNFEPCPMCIFQRIAMIKAGFFFLLGLAIGPKTWGRWLLSACAALGALAGAGIAARQVWLQHLPADQVPECGPTLDYLLNMLPLQRVVMMVLKGEGSCAKIDAQWLGITLPEWTLVTFIGLALLALVTPVIANRFEGKTS